MVSRVRRQVLLVSSSYSAQDVSSAGVYRVLSSTPSQPRFLSVPRVYQRDDPEQRNPTVGYTEVVLSPAIHPPTEHRFNIFQQADQKPRIIPVVGFQSADIVPSRFITFPANLVPRKVPFSSNYSRQTLSFLLYYVKRSRRLL